MTQYELANAGAVAESSGRGGLFERDTSRSIGSRSGWRVLALALAGLAGLVMTATSVVLTAQAKPHNQLAALGEAIVVGVPLIVALYACRRGPYPRFAWLLLVASLAWSFVGLAESTHSVPYSVGRVAQWLVEPLVIYLVLAFPSGALRKPTERAVVIASVAIAAILWLPTALLVAQYPMPAPWTSCAATCPANAFMVANHQPAFVTAIIQPTRETLTALLFLAAVVLLAGRMRDASRLTRRTQGPVLTAAIVRFVALAIFLIVRRADASASVLDLLGWLWLLTLPAIAIAFLVGILRWRLFTADALQRLTLLSTGEPGGAGLRQSLSAALDDPSLHVLYRAGDNGQTWATETGEPARLPAAGSGLDATELSGLRGQRVAIVHDAALSENRALVHAAAVHALVAIENQTLQTQIRTSMRDLAESRAQTQAAGESARRKIRQNLHDGAQQRLVALLLRLELAGPQIERDPAGGTRLLHDLADEVEQTLAEIRVLSHGLEPSVLTDRGLVEALQATVANAPLPTSIDAEGIRRYPPEVEACLYFVCMEALSNAYKHASGASAISISLRDSDGLSLEVRDDGAGFDPGQIRSGLGMASMRERLAAVGGRLTIDSAPARGTTVAASVPVRYDRRMPPCSAA